MKFIGIFTVVSVAALALAKTEPYVAEKRQSAYHVTVDVR
jgi:hypothetical protein